MVDVGNNYLEASLTSVDSYFSSGDSSSGDPQQGQINSYYLYYESPAAYDFNDISHRGNSTWDFGFY